MLIGSERNVCPFSLIDAVASDERELKALEKKIADISGRTVTAQHHARLLKAEIKRLKADMANDGSFFKIPQLPAHDISTCVVS